MEERLKGTVKAETECPECGGYLSWMVVHELGAPMYNGLCGKCNIILRWREAPEISRGKALEKYGEIDGTPVKDMKAMDKRITRLPCDVQIGILRERHCRELREENDDE